MTALELRGINCGLRAHPLESIISPSISSVDLQIKVSRLITGNATPGAFMFDAAIPRAYGQHFITG